MTMLSHPLQRIALLAAALILLALTGLTTAAKADVQRGEASWYALTSLTASGERSNPAGMTAAHRTLPFGTRVRVTNLRNGRSIVLRINDRGPFIRGRIIDVTRAAARELGFMNRGVTQVTVERLN